MNGQPTTYRISQPMAWQEFKAMPDDLQAAYINWLREKFNVPNNAIADMLGIHRTSLCKYLQSIGLQNNKRRGSRDAWDVEGFTTWRKGAGDDAAEPTEETTAQEEKTVRLDPLEESMPLELPDEAEEIQPAEAEPLQPTSGWMQFDGPADQALQTIGNLLRGKNVRLRITWDPITTEGAKYDRRQMD